MSKKPLHSRLESLFQTLNEEPPVPTEQNHGAPAGWMWECTLNGVYTHCSPEIEACLGVPADVFVGQDIFTFHIHPDSAEQVRTAIRQQELPYGVEIWFLHANREYLAARMNVISRNREEGAATIHGFTELLPIEQRNTPSADATVVANSPSPVDPGGSIVPAQSTSSAPAAKPSVITKRITSDIQVISERGNTTVVEASKQNRADNPGYETSSLATLVASFHLRERGQGMMELMDDPSRIWSEDERLLVQEVADQLALALENAELYQTVQQELTEKTRAEEEIRERNQDLARLNQAGQQISHLTTLEETYDLLCNLVAEMTGCKYVAIARYDATRRTISYPVRLVAGQRESGEEEPLSNDLASYIFWTRKPLLILQRAAAELVEKSIVHPGRTPASVLAMPLLAGDRLNGALILLDFEKENAFTPIQVELLSTLASQATTALENANLFQEIRAALSAIENRERYQANVAMVAATLSKYGSKSLAEVLALLGEASQASRVYFAQPVDYQDEKGWQVQGSWSSPTNTVPFDLPRGRTIPAGGLPYLHQQLLETGWLAKNIEDLPKPEHDFLNRLGTCSLLALSVPSQGSLPGFIAFEDTAGPRDWKVEDIRILQIATDALSNTILRENLLKQVQISLHETETLYNQSHNLALASDLSEMVATVASSTQLSGVQRAILVTFDQEAGVVQHLNVASTWHSGSGTPPPERGAEYPLSVYSDLFTCTTPVFYNDLSEAAIKPEARAALSQSGVRSLALLPLWAGRRQTGVLLLDAETRQVFTEQARRGLAPLVDQLATSVENLRLFNETQEALADTGLLYKVSSAISKATEPHDLVKVVVDSLLPAAAQQVTLILVNDDSEGKPGEMEVVSSYNVQSHQQIAGATFNTAALSRLWRFQDGSIIVPDIRVSQIDVASKRQFQQLGIIGACFTQLYSGGRLIGVLVVSSPQPNEFQHDDHLKLLEVAASGMAVALEKYRLLAKARRRALELQTASEIARDTTSTLSLDQLLSGIVNVLLERFNYYHASIFLLDSSKSQAVVREATGEAGQEMKQNGYKVAVGSKTVIGSVTASGQPVVIGDAIRNPLYKPNPLLPETRSEMGLPLRIGEEVIGALDLQSIRANAFGQDDATVLQILADQIAVAIENARAFELSQKAYEEMREVDRVKSQFLANMSHELRTPLNSIIGFSRVILKGIDGEINETQKQDLTAIYHSGQHLLGLINDILDLSKIEAGKMELSYGELEVQEMIASAMSTATGLVKGKPVQLKKIVPEDLPIIRADPTRVRQVLINFLSNAAKFTDEGTITVEAQIITGPDDRPEMMITVTDSGAGIAPEDEKKLFQPFSQVDDSPTRKTGGTGLGLSICRSLIEMHGGRIGLLRSEVGVGSTFFFTLPMPLPEPPAPANPDGVENKVIMAVDDDSHVISLYDRFLQSQGYQVVAVTDPNQAVQRAKEVRPAAITLDIMMPGKDGWTVMAELKADPLTRSIPIIVCSILQEEQKGFSLGAADYLVKPFIPDDLVNVINRVNPEGKIHEILVIDDSPDDLRLAQKMLEENKNYQVLLAEGGQAGWDALQTHQPDAILLDLFMPDLNGFELLDRLHADPKLSSIPVIVLSGAELKPEQRQQLNDFGQDMLVKGHLSQNELLASLEQSLKQFHLISAK